MKKNLFSLILTGIMVATLLTGCISYPNEFKPNPLLEMVGTMPEGYMETFTSLEDSVN